MSSEIRLGLRVAVATHYYTTGQPDLLIEFLKERVTQLLVIRHSFFYANDVASRSELYKHGVKIKEEKFYSPKLGEFSLYLRDFMLTLFIALRLKTKFKLYIGADCLNTFAGIVLRKIRLVEKVVMYEIDLPIKRFNNSMLNLLYHKLDVYCAERCDFIWDLSPRMEAVRKMFGWKKREKVTKILVPAVFEPTRSPNVQLLNQQRMIFVGHLRESQGLQLVIESFSEILSKVPNAKLVIIGTGPYEEKLRQMAHESELKDAIEFLGYVEDHRDIERVLFECGIGLAPYVPDLVGITTYADPMKPKVYMACGLPVIITDVPWVASLIGKNDAGIVIRYDKEDFIRAALKLMKNHEFYLNCRKNALGLAREYYPDKVFSEALSRSLKSHVLEDVGSKRDVVDDVLLIHHRERIASAFVNYITDATSVLDVGCGDGLLWTGYFAEFAGYVVGIDRILHKKWRSEKPRNVDFVVADARRLPFKDKSFYTVFEKDALHHIEASEKALGEMVRVSKLRLIIVEANRYNPISYIHMVKICKHEHFTLKKLKMLLNGIGKARLFSVETHYYPTKSKLIANFFLLFQRFLEKALPPILRNYNIAIIQFRHETAYH
jgi:glycosyltransferase involved in cell wall biosynthesis/ubiquinone/menaquinone biosynthesis C-methylase UbiE